VAESLIPTASGKYRVRAYRHSVRELAAWCKDAIVPVPVLSQACQPRTVWAPSSLCVCGLLWRRRMGE